jgi:nucleoside-diphosphate-sugar epimerase
VAVSEDDWSDPDWEKATAYVVSKTRAELALWQWAHEHDWSDRVTTINPSVILGPTLDAYAGSSTEIIRAFMTGVYPLLPPLTLLMVDIRDVVELHARAMTMPITGSRRLLAAGDALHLTEVAAILSEAFPAYAKQIPTVAAPAFLVRMAARFDRTLQTIVPDLGVIPIAETGYVTELTGVTFRPSAEAVRATGQSLIDYGVV